MKIYLETSVPNFLFAEDAPEKQEITKNFFKNDIKKHELFLSDLVLDEIAKSSKEKKEKMQEVISNLKFKELKINNESEQLAKAERSYKQSSMAGFVRR